MQPESIRPAGYPAFLRAVLWVHDLAVVPAVQHLLGLATGTLVYALVRRLGIGPVGACIAAAPVLFDAYQLNIEQHILSEALFTLLVVAALARAAVAVAPVARGLCRRRRAARRRPR